MKYKVQGKNFFEDRATTRKACSYNIALDVQKINKEKLFLKKKKIKVKKKQLEES